MPFGRPPVEELCGAGDAWRARNKEKDHAHTVPPRRRRPLRSAPRPLPRPRLREVARRLPEDVGKELVEPVADGILHRALARHTVREIFSTERAEIQQALSEELTRALALEGVIVKALFLGTIDLPARYKEGM